MRGGVTTVAVKVMGETTAGQRQAAKLLEQQDMFQREIHLLKSCRDRNIVQFLGACVEVLGPCAQLMHAKSVYCCSPGS